MVQQLWMPHADGVSLIKNTLTDSDYEINKNKPGVMPVIPGINPYTGEPMDPQVDVIAIEELKNQQAYVAPKEPEPVVIPEYRVANQRSNTDAVYYGPYKYYGTLAGTVGSTLTDRNFGYDKDLSNASEQEIIDAYNAYIKKQEEIAATNAAIAEERRLGDIQAKQAEAEKRAREAQIESEKRDQMALNELTNISNTNDLNSFLTKWDTDKNTSTIELSSGLLSAVNSKQSEISNAQKEQDRLYKAEVSKQMKTIAEFKIPSLIPPSSTAAEYETNINSIINSSKQFDEYVKSLDLDKSTPTIELDPSVLPMVNLTRDAINSTLKSADLIYKSKTLTEKIAADQKTYAPISYTPYTPTKSAGILDIIQTAAGTEQIQSSSLVDYLGALFTTATPAVPVISSLPTALESGTKAGFDKLQAGFLQSGTSVGDIYDYFTKGTSGVVSGVFSTAGAVQELVTGKDTELDKFIDTTAGGLYKGAENIIAPVVGGVKNVAQLDKLVIPDIGIGAINVASAVGTGLTTGIGEFGYGTTKKQAEALTTFTALPKGQEDAIVSGAAQAGKIVYSVAPMLATGPVGTAYGGAMLLSGTPEQAASSLLMGTTIGVAGRAFDVGATAATRVTGNIPLLGNIASGTAYLAPKVDTLYDIYQIGTTGTSSVAAAMAGEQATADQLTKDLIVGLGGSKVGVKLGETAFDVTAGTGLYSQAAVTTKVDVPGRDPYSIAEQLFKEPTVDVLSVQKSYKSIDTLTARDPGTIGDISTSAPGMFATIKESGSIYGDVGKFFVDKSGPSNIKINNIEIPGTKVVDAFVNPSRPTIYDIPLVKTGADIFPTSMKESILTQLETTGKVDIKTQEAYLKAAQEYADITKSPVATISPKILTGKSTNLESEVFLLLPSDTGKLKLEETQTIGLEPYTRVPVVRSTMFMGEGKMPATDILTKNISDNINKTNIALDKLAITANRKLSQTQGFEKSGLISYDAQAHGKQHLENVYSNLLMQKDISPSLQKYSDAELKYAAYLHDVTKVRAPDIDRIEHGTAAGLLASTGRLNVPLDVDGTKVMFESFDPKIQKDIIAAVSTHTSIKPINSILSKHGTSVTGLVQGIKGTDLAKALANADRLDMTRFGGTADTKQMFTNLLKQDTKQDTSKTFTILPDTTYKDIGTYKPFSAGVPSDYSSVSSGYKLSNYLPAVPKYASTDSYVDDKYIPVLPEYKSSEYKLADIYKSFASTAITPEYKSGTTVYAPDYKPVAMDYKPDYKPTAPEYKPTIYNDILPNYVLDYKPTAPNYKSVYEPILPDYKPDYKPVVPDYKPDYKLDVSYKPTRYDDKFETRVKYDKKPLTDYFGGEMNKSYDVYVRKGSAAQSGKNKKIKEVLVEKGLPYNAALTKGLTVADKYSQRTAILRPRNKSPTKPDTFAPPQSLLNQFRQPTLKSKLKAKNKDLVFIEKSRYAINTPDEKRGIPYRAQQLRKERQNLGIFAPTKKPKNKKSGWLGMRI